MTRLLHWLVVQGAWALIPHRFDRASAGDLDAAFELRILRSGAAGAWSALSLVIAGGRCVVRRGSDARATATATLAPADLLRLGAGAVGWPALMASGRLELSGDPFLALRFPALFRLPTERRIPTLQAMSDRAKRIRDRVESLAASKPGSWFFLNIANPIDRRLLPATGGRVSLSVGQPVLCLEVRGAKTGKLRRTPLLFAELDGDLVLIASATGRPKHPAWYRNLTANPRVRLYAPGGRSGEYIARTAEGEERERGWAAARRLYKGFDVYEDRTTGIREIPVVVLSRAS